MPDAYTTTASLASDVAAYERLSYFAFRAEQYFERMADVKPTRQTTPGATVSFTKYTELAAVTTELSESVDVDAVAVADSQVTVTLKERGNAVVTTAKLRATSFLEVDRDVANLLGYNAGDSIDTIVRDEVSAGTNVRYAGAATSRAGVTATDKLTANNVRRAKAELRGASVPTFGGLYNAFIHPDVAYDLQGETGGAGWRDPHVYSQPAEIWNGEIGAFEGFRFMDTPRAAKFVDAGSGTPAATDVYATLFAGRQALAKAFSNADGNGPNPRVIPGPITDKLRRFQPLGWYHFVGYGIFRNEALRRVESASSIGNNAVG